MAKAAKPTAQDASSTKMLEALGGLAEDLLELEFPNLHLDSLKVEHRKKGQNSYELKQRHGKILLTLALPINGAKDFPALVRRAGRAAEQIDQRRVYVPAKILAKLFENVELSEAEKLKVSTLLYGDRPDPASVKAATVKARDQRRKAHEKALADEIARQESMAAAVAAREDSSNES